MKRKTENRHQQKKNSSRVAKFTIKLPRSDPSSALDTDLRIRQVSVYLVSMLGTRRMHGPMVLEGVKIALVVEGDV